MAELLQQSGLLAIIALIAWIGQWGRTNRFAHYLVLVAIGLSGTLLIGAGSLILLAAKLPMFEIYPQFSLAVVSYTEIFGWIFVAMGACAAVSLIPFIRRFLAKTIFPGLDVTVSVHTWALYIFLTSIILFFVMITIFFNPDLIIEIMKNTPLVVSSAVQAVSFVLFAFIAAGVWIYKPFKQTASDLGLTSLPWKTIGLMVGAAAILAIAIQIIELGLYPLVDPEMLESIEKVISAFGFEGTVRDTLIRATVLGLAAGIGEETLFRGLIQPVFGIIPTAILFTLLHTHYGLTVLLLELLLIGIILGVIRQRFNTTAAIIVHAAFDFFAFSSSVIFHS